jgi:hypothetical protein
MLKENHRVNPKSLGSDRTGEQAGGGKWGKEVDLICFSHLRWDIVYRRPQQLLSRCARTRRVFFVEEAIFDGRAVRFELQLHQPGVWVTTPHLPPGAGTEALRVLIDKLISWQGVNQYVLWYDTPMALPFTRHLTPVATIYDCMDEPSTCDSAPPEHRQIEAELLTRADLVFTGGHSQFSANRVQHPHVYAFPNDDGAEGALGDEDAGRATRKDPRQAPTSWDHTWARMEVLIARIVAGGLN